MNLNKNYNSNIEELKKKFIQLNLYDLYEVSKFSLKLLNLELIFNENLKIKILSFSISALYDNYLKKYIYLIDINYIKNDLEFSGDFEEFMKDIFNLKLPY